MTREEVHWLLYNNSEDVLQADSLLYDLYFSLENMNDFLGYWPGYDGACYIEGFLYPCVLPSFFIQFLFEYFGWNAYFSQSCWVDAANEGGLMSTIFYISQQGDTFGGTFGELLVKIAEFTEIYGVTQNEFYRVDERAGKVTESDFIGKSENQLFFDYQNIDEEIMEIFVFGMVFAPLENDIYESTYWEEECPLIFKLEDGSTEVYRSVSSQDVIATFNQELGVISPKDCLLYIEQ